VSDMGAIEGFKGSLLAQVPLIPYTTWRIGGTAELLAEPVDEADIRILCEYARTHGLPLYLLGNGSNVLIADAGLPGLVICMKSHTGIVIDAATGIIQARAGTLLPHLARKAAQAGIAGLEFLCNIPGTVGGAVVGNAGTGGAQGPSVEKVLRQIQVLDLSDLSIQMLPLAELHYAYRRSRTLKTVSYVVLSAEFYTGTREAPEQILHRQQQISAQRREKQPRGYAAGSVFRLPDTVAPEAQTPGWYIDRAGLKGLRIGGAMVSEQHANWIINDGTATAQDILALIAVVTAHVQAQFDITLELEICRLQ